MTANLKKPSNRPSDVFLISALQFPHIATSSASKTAEYLSRLNLNVDGRHTHTQTHTSQNTYGEGSAMGKIHKEGRWEIPHLFWRDQPYSACIKCSRCRALGLRCEMHLWICLLDPRKQNFLKRLHFWSWILATNQTKALSMSPPRTVWKDDVILQVSLSAPWWQEALNAFTYQLNVKVMMPDLFRGALEESEFQDGSPSALVPHCMQLVPFVVLFSLAPQTSQDHHCAGSPAYLRICTFVHFQMFACFCSLFHSSTEKPWLQHRNETGLVIT